MRSVPFGGIETFWSLVSGAGLVRRIAASSVILLAGTVIVALVFRRAFCGYFCALGAIQELFGKIGHAIWPKNRPTMPAAIDGPARYLKYVVLVFFTLWTFQAAALVIRPYDPWVAWMHLTSAELFAEFGIGAAVLGVSLVGSVVYDRFFCKYLCPMGAFLAIISPVSLFKVRRDAETCIDCRKCDKACPVNLTVSESDTVKDAECINCNECVNVCPVKDTLVVSSVGSERVTLTPNMVLGTALAIFAIVIGATTMVGAFAWTMPTLAQTTVQTGGMLDVENIKGSMTFVEVSEATGIAPSEFQSAFGVSTEELNLPMKDSAAKYGFDIHTDLREWVRARMAAGATGAAGAPAAAGTEAGGCEDAAGGG